MSEPIVSLANIRRRAQACADAGHCPHAARPWPLESVAGQASLEHVDALQNAEHSHA